MRRPHRLKLYGFIILLRHNTTVSSQQVQSRDNIPVGVYREKGDTTCQYETSTQDVSRHKFETRFQYNQQNVLHVSCLCNFYY